MIAHMKAPTTVKHINLGEILESADAAVTSDQNDPNLLYFGAIVTECVDQFKHHFSAYVSNAEFQQKWNAGAKLPDTHYAEAAIADAKGTALTAIQRNKGQLLSELRSAFELAQVYRDKLIEAEAAHCDLLAVVPRLREVLDSLDTGTAQSGATTQIDALSNMIAGANPHSNGFAEASMACAYLDRSIERVIQRSSDARFAIRLEEESFLTNIENLPSEYDDADNLDEVIPF